MRATRIVRVWWMVSPPLERGRGDRNPARARSVPRGAPFNFKRRAGNGAGSHKAVFMVPLHREGAQGSTPCLAANGGPRTGRATRMEQRLPVPELPEPACAAFAENSGRWHQAGINHPLVFFSKTGKSCHAKIQTKPKFLFSACIGARFATSFPKELSQSAHAHILHAA